MQTYYMEFKDVQFCSFASPLCLKFVHCFPKMDNLRGATATPLVGGGEMDLSPSCIPTLPRIPAIQ